MPAKSFTPVEGSWMNLGQNRQGRAHVGDAVSTANSASTLVKTAPVAGHDRLVQSPGRLTRLPTAVGHGSAAILRPGLAEVRRAITAERGRGLAFLMLPVLMGAGAALYFSLDRDPDMTKAGLAGLALVAAWTIARWNWHPARHPFAAALIVLAGFCAAHGETVLSPVTLLDADVTTRVTGRVEQHEIDGAGRVRYLIAVERTSEPRLRRPPERVRLVVRARHEPVPIGARISGEARLMAPSGPALPGGYDFGYHAFAIGTGANGFFFRPPALLAAPEPAVSVFGRLADETRRLRGAIAARIRSVVPGDPGALAATLTVSDQRGISEPVMEAFRATGLAHVLSISGLHMALAAGTLYVGLRRLFALFPTAAEAYPVKKLAAAGAILAATVYLFISGASVPAQRSWLMLMVMLVAVLVDRPALTMRNVALAAIVVIVLAPSSVTSPGFQMSFAATAALIAAYGGWARLARARKRRPTQRRGPASILVRLVSTIAGLLATALVAGLATGIYSAYHFHRIAAYGMLANLLAMPLVSLFVMPAGVAALLLMPLGLDRLPLQIMGLALDGVVRVAVFVESLGGDVVVGRLGFGILLTATLGLGLLVFLRTWLALSGAVIAAGAVLATAGPGASKRPDLIISEDGRLVGILTDRAIATTAQRPGTFLFSQWQMALGVQEHRPPLESGLLQVARTAPGAPQTPTSSTAPDTLLPALAKLAEAEPGRFACAGRLACVAVVKKVTVVLTGEAARIGQACDMADLVIVAIPVHMQACRSGALLVTARSLRKTGSLAIRISDDEAGMDANGAAALREQDVARGSPDGSPGGSIDSNRIARSGSRGGSPDGSTDNNEITRGSPDGSPGGSIDSNRIARDGSRGGSPGGSIDSNRIARSGSPDGSPGGSIDSNRIARGGVHRSFDGKAVDGGVLSGFDSDVGCGQAACRPSAVAQTVLRLDVTTALGGVIRPWTIHRYYDWRRGRYTFEDDTRTDRHTIAAPVDDHLKAPRATPASDQMPNDTRVFSGIDG